MTFTTIGHDRMSNRESATNKALDTEPPIASFLKSKLIGGGPVNASVRRVIASKVSMSTIIITPLTTREKDFVIDLATRYERNEYRPNVVEFDSIVRPPNETEQEFKNLLAKFERLGCVHWPSGKSFTVLNHVREFAHDVLHPPIPNYFASLTQWWFATRWRAIITLTVVLLPLIVQWIEMLQKILEWLLPTK